MSKGEIIKETEFRNGGVTVWNNQGNFGIIVELRCVGCGGQVDEFEAFPDTVEENAEMKPLHDKISCREKAEEAKA